MVGIGASAGGLEALQKFFPGLAADTGMSFVVIQHLDPKQVSHLPELLRASSKLPVQVVKDGVTIEPNNVYVIPPNKNITIAKNKLELTSRPDTHAVQHPFNHFLKSLAGEREHLAIGVVLSGTGTDGTLGMGEIKSAGGITFAQDERTAQHSGMPSAAIQSGYIDYVLPPEEIARELGRIATHPHVFKVRHPDQPDHPEEPNLAGHEFERILSILKSRTQVDFTQYRPSTLKRRIMRRMVIRKIEQLTDYIRVVENEPAETHALFYDLLINVTSFFRDPEMYEILKARVFPEMVAAKANSDTIRLWVVGCSTGQEAYSLAINLLEFLDDQAVRPAVQLFATDISDPHALSVARAGVYPESIRAEMTPQRLQRFFTREEGGFRILKSIREMCIFARQNLVSDPPFSRIDLVSCRNVLIYLTTATQKKIIPMFHYSLNVPGYLVLGSSETVGGFSDLFSPVDKRHRIFARKAIQTRDLGPFTVAPAPWRNDAIPPPIAAVPPKLDVQAEADRILLQRYAPGGVIINNDLDVLHFRGRTSPWLEPPRGDGRLNIQNMARQSLYLEMRQGVQEAFESGRKVTRENVRGGNDPGDRVNLDITPIKPRSGQIESYLVVFEAAPVQATNKAPAPSPMPVDTELRNLREELASANQYVQSVIEQQEASTEELRSANEEIMSANEELQSTNEELETAKEELQSTNEELTTLNQELQTRNYELAQLTDDLLNLLASLRIPIIMLTSDLRIRRFTPGASKFFNLLPTDLGRPLTDVHTVIDVPNLPQVILNVIGDVTPYEKEVRDRDHRWHMLRVAPYRTTDNKIDGAVLMLLDIDAAKTATGRIQAAADYTSSVIAALHDPLVILDEHFRIDSANPAYCDILGCDPDALCGQPFFQAHSGIWNNPHFRQRLTRLVHSEDSFEDYIIDQDFPGRGHLSFSVRGRLLRLPEAPQRLMLVFHDVTELKSAAHREKEVSDAERAARMDVEQINRIKDNFLAMLSHDLRTPLNSVLGWTQILKKEKGVNQSKVKEALDGIENAARTQVRMIGDLLDISRITSGKLSLNLKEVDLPEVLDAAVQLFVPEAQDKKIQIVRQFEPVRGTVLADPERVQQIVGNLVSNAIKFTPPQGRIEVELRDVDHSAQIAVRDTGPGIPPGFQKHMFQMFRQADGPRDKKSTAGLGLGLAIVKHLVTLHGGDVHAENHPAGGARFTLTFPYSDIAFPHSERTGRALESGKMTDGPDLAGLRVLIVDDDPEACAIVRRIFEEHKTKVFVALSARDGLDIIRHEKPDVIVSDIGMPDQDGYELMRQIRKLPPEQGGRTPAIALTAFARPEDRKQAMAVGYQKHLAKPVDPVELLTVIATLTSKK